MEAAALYNDFSTLASLRTEARADAAGTLDEVAQQFESLFVQMMLKSMRDATMKSGLLDSHQLETYEQMYDQQLSVDLARQGGVGLADVIVRQLSGDASPVRARSDTDAGLRLPAAVTGAGPALPLKPADGATTGAAGLEAYRAQTLPTPAMTAVPGSARSTDTGTMRDSGAPGTPADFVTRLRPLAETAARELGVDPDVLLAQAALETGWGRRVIGDGQGSSNNLFNIKAGNDWAGPTVTVRTVEYREGLAVRETAAFRAYESAQESFADYVAFLRDNPRYAPALEAASDGEAYLRSLQAGGYATDPAYADKILDILGRDELLGRGDLAEANAGLKKAADLPLAG